MKRPWPIIAVADVVKSTAWYLTLLEAQQNHPGATVFNQILDPDGTVLLCLHHRGPSGPKGDHHWPSLSDPETVAPATASCSGSWLTISMRRGPAQELGGEIHESPNTNNGTGMPAFVVRDPDGYYVTVNEAPNAGHDLTAA